MLLKTSVLPISTVVLLIISLNPCHLMPYTLFITGGTRNKRTTLECYPDPATQYNGMRVFLTVSSLATTINDTDILRHLELNWFNEEPLNDDLVALYRHDPIVNLSRPLMAIKPIDYPERFYRTLYTFPRPEMLSLTAERRCLGYWIGYIRQGQLLASNCIKMQPNWMWENRLAIGPVKYIDMMIPGTHDAGSYAYYSGKTSNIFQRWMINQEENFFEQLMYGIRHFDLRLAYYSETPEKFWINHFVFRSNPFHEMISAVKRFINLTNEIILLDFHEFPVGFDNQPERHVELINYLVKELGDYMMHPSVGYQVTMDAIWQSNKRLIVSYSNPERINSALLWPGIPQLWANTMNGDYLKIFMDNEMNKQRTIIWSAQLEFTPTAADVVFSPSSLRILADKINRNVTEWCRDIWWDRANVVAVDFFLGSNIIEVAIDSNLKRRTCIDKMIAMKNGSTWSFNRS
ncbi:hypothetical protein CHUAL_001905 [Chamberlinius hualienensis]